MGAKLIEKHFTLDKKMKGPDHLLSADIKQMKELVIRIRKIEEIRGNGIKDSQRCEKEGLIGIRRSLIAAKDLKKGVILGADSIKIARPAKGIQPKFLKKVIGKKMKKSVKKDNPLMWAHLD